MTNKKDTKGTLGRMAAPTAGAGSAPPAIAPPAIAPPSEPDLSTDTVNMAVSRLVLLRIKRYALILQEREGGRGTQRAVAERMLHTYFDGARPAVNLPQTEPVLRGPSGTIALSRSLVLRLKRYTLDLAEQLGRTVSMREVADAIFNSALEEVGIPAVSE